MEVLTGLRPTPSLVADRDPCVGPSQRMSTVQRFSADDGRTLTYRLEFTKFGYWDLAGVGKSERTDDLVKRTFKMARKTLQPTLGVSFFASSTDRGMYVTGVSTIS